MDNGEVDELLASFGWNDRIRSNFSRLLAEIEEASYRHPISEIPLIGRRLSALFGRLAPHTPVSRDLLEAFSHEFLAAAERLLQLTQELRLFERTMEVEGMVRLCFHNLQNERRDALRFPVGLPARLLVQTRITSIALANISLTGVQFYVRQPLQNHIRYPFMFESAILFSSTVTPLHQQVLCAGSEEKIRVGGPLDPPLSWSDIRRTLVFLYGQAERIKS
jgi:hypothetical protein